MFCPFVKGPCNSECVFRCRPCASSQSMMEPTTTCLMVKTLDAANDMHSSVLDARKLLHGSSLFRRKPIDAGPPSVDGSIVPRRALPYNAAQYRRCASASAIFAARHR